MTKRVDERGSSIAGQSLILLGGIATGAGVMLLLDPDRGRRRRALIADKLASLRARSTKFAGKASRDLGNRARGLAHEARRGNLFVKSSDHTRSNTFEFMQQNWTPAARVVAGVTGGTLALYGAGRRGILGTAAGMAGAGLLARSISNVQLAQLLASIGGRGVGVEKTIHIKAPVESVYDFWTSYQNFPLFMSNLVEVRDTGAGRSRWIAKAPLGARVEWDARITEAVPNSVLAWASLEGSTIPNEGVLRFERVNEMLTRVDVKLSYRPPAGALGHTVARLFGADPKSEMDADLLRAKMVLEGHKPAHDAAARSNPDASQVSEK